MANNINNKKRTEVFKKYNGKCAYCGVKLDINNFTIDHIKPIYRDYGSDLSKYGIDQEKRGNNDMENLNPCCISCNCSKSTFTIEKWRIELSKKIERELKNNSTFRILIRFGLIKLTNKNVIFYYEKYE